MKVGGEEYTDKEMFDLMFTPPMVFYNFEKREYYLKNPGDFLTKRKEAIRIINSLIRFYRKTSSKEIKQINEEINKQMMEVMRRIDSEPKPKPKQGFIYFLKAPNGAMKIGRTAKIKDRFEQLSIQLPFETKIRYTIRSNNYIKLEKLFHSYYEKIHIKGEWFDFSGKDIVQEMEENDLPPEIEKLIVRTKVWR